MSKNKESTQKTDPRFSAQQAETINESIAALRTQTDRSRGIIGFGRRIIVSPDEIHVVVGDGRHVARIADARKVFGQSADRPSRYWLNTLTQVIKLKTVSFTVPLHGTRNEGIDALDSSKVSFRLWAHAVAKLNPDKAETAAQRVGLDTTGLINTIGEVGTAELIAAAATMSLQDTIGNRQKLAEIAFPKVNQILSELGYDLALLTVTKLGGSAYQKLVEQAESRISKETSIDTNREQLAELGDDQVRQRQEAEVRATTEKKLAAERLEAEREVELATIAQQESLSAERHEMNLLQIGRAKSAAEKQQESNLTQVQLAQSLGEAEAEKAGRLAIITAEREASLRAEQQVRQAKLALAQAEADAERLAIEQAKEIERASKLTEAEAERLRREELAKATRSKEIALIATAEATESRKMEAQSMAESELVRAEAEATATEKRAEAAKIRAEATRAEEAAPGLAAAEVAAAEIKVAEQKVAVTRAEAAAEVEKLERLRNVEISAQKELATLYEQSPVLVELEELRMQLAHEEAITEMRTAAQLKAIEAIAPGVKIHLYGSSAGGSNDLISKMISFGHGINTVGEEVPLLGQLLNGQDKAIEADAATAVSNLVSKFSHLMPVIKEATSEMNPRMLSGLSVADLMERVVAISSGKEDLSDAVAQIKQDASFRMIGDLPVGSLLKLIGAGEKSAATVEDIDVS